VLGNIGAGLGPWNHDQYGYRPGPSGVPLVNNVPVVFYHFHSLDLASQAVFIPSRHAHYAFTEEVIRHCYLPYLNELARAIADLGAVQPTLNCGLTNIIFNNMLFIAKTGSKNALARFFESHDLLSLDADWDCYVPKERRQHIELSPGSAPAAIGPGKTTAPTAPADAARDSVTREEAALISAFQSMEQSANPKYEELEKQAYDFLDDHMYNRRIMPRLIAMQEKMYQGWLSKSLREDINYRKRPYALSAIVSTYKSGAFMDECLRDLTSQTIGEALEIIIVDAASPENERAVTAEFQKRFSNIRYVRLPERIGIYPAWNLGIHYSSGECITPFSTNDRLRPDAYEIMLRHLKKNPATALVYGDTHLTNLPHQTYAKYAPLRNNSDFLWPPFNYYQLLFNCLVGPHPVWRRFVHKEVGYFDPRYSAIADQDFWLRTGKFFTLEHIPEFTGLQWLADDSLSCRATGQMEIFDIQRKHQKNWLKERNAQYTTVEMGATLTLFMLILTRLIESKNLPEVLSFWDRHHAMFPAVPQVTQIRELVGKVRKMIGVSQPRV
jgi:glycosyltransferase involved in cell wall biosynthesis